MKAIKTAVNTVLITLALGLVSTQAFAYYDVQDTGDLLKPNQLSLGTSLQWITHGDAKGVNILGRLDKGFNDDSNFRFEAGTGTVDAVIGAYYKWVPFPDYDNQPAVGFTFGAQYAHYKGANEFAARFIPLASKKFAIDPGEITPYAALPIALSSYDNNGRTPIQLTLGARYLDNNFKKCEFLAELGFDINQAPNSIVVGASFPAFESF